MIRFKLQHSGEIGDLCVDVLIYKSLRAMRSAIERTHGLENEKGGALTAFDPSMPRPRIYFCQDWLTLDVVAHEFFHLGIEFAAMKYGQRGVYKNQEAAIDAAGEFIRLFWNRYMGLGDEYHIAGTKKLFEKDFSIEKRQQ